LESPSIIPKIINPIKFNYPNKYKYCKTKITTNYQTTNAPMPVISHAVGNARCNWIDCIDLHNEFDQK